MRSLFSFLSKIPTIKVDPKCCCHSNQALFWRAEFQILMGSSTSTLSQPSTPWGPVTSSTSKFISHVIWRGACSIIERYRAVNVLLIAPALNDSFRLKSGAPTWTFIRFDVSIFDCLSQDRTSGPSIRYCCLDVERTSWIPLLNTLVFIRTQGVSVMRIARREVHPRATRKRYCT